MGGINGTEGTALLFASILAELAEELAQHFRALLGHHT